MIWNLTEYVFLAGISSVNRIRILYEPHRTRAGTRDRLYGILFRRQCDLIVRNVRTRNSENTRRVIESKTCVRRKRMGIGLCADLTKRSLVMCLLCLCAETACPKWELFPRRKISFDQNLPIGRRVHCS